MKKHSDTLNHLLNEGRAFHVVFGKGLANHLSMSLIALEKMGAKEQRLIDFYNSYVPRLEELPNAALQEPENPLETLGKAGLFANHQAYFSNSLEKYGTEEVLKGHLPSLLPGICTSAFHAQIRLGYGIEVSDQKEIAYALAYWSAHFQPLGKLGPKVSETPFEILEDTAPVARSHSFSPGNIAARMGEVAGLKALKTRYDNRKRFLLSCWPNW